MIKHIYKEGNGCINKEIKIAFLNGKFSYYDYLELMFHCDSCPSCKKALERMEAIFIKDRPLYDLDQALKQPFTSRCLSDSSIGKLVAGDVEMGSSQYFYCVYHLCFCSRCYALYCHTLGSETFKTPDGKAVSVIFPANTLNDQLLIAIIGYKKYNGLRKLLDLRPGDKIFSYLARAEDLNSVLLVLQYGKSGGEYILNSAYFNYEDYFVDGIELR